LRIQISCTINGIPTTLTLPFETTSNLTAHPSGYQTYEENILNGTHHLGELGTDRRIILKWFSRKKGVTMQTRFMCLQNKFSELMFMFY
jgi:hypothetical protein